MPMIPPVGPGTNWGNGLEDAYPAVGLAGLAQGFTQGLQIGQNWGNEADKLQAHREQMADNAAFRNQQAKETQASHVENEKYRTGMLDMLKQQAGAIGTPVLDANGTVIGYQTGKGGIVKPAASKSDKEAGGLSLLNDVDKQWDKLGAGNNTLSATYVGSKLKAQSQFPSTLAGQYNANAQALAGKIDHDLLGRVNDLTIKNARESIPGFFDTPESKKRKIDVLKGIYQKAGINAPAKDAGARFSELIAEHNGDKNAAFAQLHEEGF